MIQVAGYRIVEELVVGRDSVVSRAIREVDGRAVVLKTLKSEFPSRRQVAPLRHEYEIARQLEIDGVLRPLALEEQGGRVSLIVEDVGGRSLKTLLGGKPLDVGLALEIAAAAARILAEIHSRHVIHKDIKPHNIIVVPEGGARPTDHTREALGRLEVAPQRWAVFITDFGASSQISKESPTVRNPEALQGTLAYMPPEQTGRMNRAVDYRSDFYSLGVTLYEMLTGRLPFDTADPLELVHCHIARHPAPPLEINPAVPPAVSAVVMKLLAKTAEERYQSARGLIGDLERCRSGRVDGFVPGRDDVSDAFQIPQRLYGREAESATLLGAFDRVAGGATELMLVSGQPGIGKSALIQEIHKPIVRERGYFISGKFDQYERMVPYSALIQAGSDLVRQLLTEPVARIERWRAELLEALGPNGRVVLDVIPELEAIVGEQPAVPPLPPTESQNRFNLVFQDFIRVFARDGHPLALFLDDLQWSDAATLKLLKAMVSDPRTRHLFVIGAYRDSEVSPTHPLLICLQETRDLGAVLHGIHLGPLSPENVNQLVADSLRCEPERAAVLSDIMNQRTGGNPFFVIQLLKALDRDRLLRYNPQARRWDYEPEKIAALGITDDVVAFLVQEIQRFAPRTREVLTLAACIGNQFDLDMLSAVQECAPERTAADLWEAVRAGLVLPCGEEYKYVYEGAPGDTQSVSYRFLHDRVQQAVASQLSEASRQALHLRIGRLMLGHVTADELEDRLFDVVGHFNEAVALLDDPVEKRRLAELNLRAGVRARNSAAYEAARQNLEVAATLLPPDAWETAYDLSFQIYKALAEAEYLAGLMDQAATRLDGVRRHVRSRTDDAALCLIQIDAYNTLNQLAKAVEVGIEGLKAFGVHLPEKPSQAAILLEALKAKINLGRRPIASLVDLPLLQDPDLVAQLGLMNRLLPSLYLLGRQDLMTLAVIKMVNISLRHGNTADSTFAYVVYAFVLGAGLGDYRGGDAFGEMALALTDRLHCRQYLCRNEFVVGQFVSTFTQTLAFSREHAWDAIKAGMAYGDINYTQYAMIYTLMGYAGLGFDPLEAVHDAWEKFGGFLGWTNDLNFLHQALMYRQVALCLEGRTQNPCSLSDDAYDEDAAVAIFQENQFITGLEHHALDKLRLAWLYDDVAGMRRYEPLASANENVIMSTRYLAKLHLFRVLALARVDAEVEGAERSRGRQKILKSRKLLKGWSALSPEGFLDAWHLACGEVARIYGRDAEAMERYDRAIAAASQHGNVMVEAAANEAAARLLREGGRHTLASAYLKAAHYAYARWGATAKVAQLERLFPELIVEPAAAAPSTTATSASRESMESLDLETVVRTTQAIAGEVTLRGLQRKLLRNLLENAGAQKVVLMLKRDGALAVEAVGAMDEAPLLASRPVDDGAVVPSAIVRYVERSGKSVVLADAGTDPLFAADPYVRERRPRSVLCAPIVNQTQLSGVVYLENNLAADAFTPERLGVVRVLSAQAAISLDNAILYDRLEEYSHTLEEKVEARTHELSEQYERLKTLQDQIVLQQKMAYLGTLTAGIAHEIKNPLNFVNNFAELSVELVQEMREAPDEAAEILETLQQNLRKIREHGRRADGIVNSMLLHAREPGGTPQAVDLNALVEESARLAYHGLQADHEALPVTLEFALDAGLKPIPLVAQDFSRVILNVVNNACYAAVEKAAHGESGETPTVRVRTSQAGDRVEVRVWDNGNGIPAEARDKIFNPFYTTKPTGQGTGLGLSISYDIVRQHGGTMEVASEEGRFTEFVIALPG